MSMRIGSMRLRLVNASPAMARTVATGVANGIAQRVPTHLHGSIGQLTIRVRAGHNAPSELQRAAADAVGRALSKLGEQSNG